MKKTLFFLMICVLLAGYVQAGIEWKVKSVTQGQSKKDYLEMEMHMFAQDGNVRQEFVSVNQKNQFYGPGVYWLYLAKENKLYLVNEQEKSYSEIPFDYLFKIGESLGKLIQVTVENPEVKLEKLGSETILNYPCNHYKLSTVYDIEVKVAIIKTRSRDYVEREIWATPAIKLAEMGDPFRGRDFKTGFPDVDQLVEKQMKAEGEMGFPLKIISTTVSEDKKGRRKEKSRTEQEVTLVQIRQIPAEMFSIPAGFSPVQLLEQ